MKTDLSKFNNNWYKPGASVIKQIIWYYVNIFFFKSTIFPFKKLKILILRLFGATIGKNTVIKPGVNIKYPWKLTVGENSWIGENVWIDNLDHVEIGANCCISQGALLLCGNHNYSSQAFDLITQKIIISDGAWVGAKCVVVPGCIIGNHAVLTVGSVAVGALKPFGVYSGNKAVWVKQRTIN